MSFRWIEMTGAGNVYPGDKIFLNSTGGAFTATLPASPSASDMISFIDGAGDCETHNVTIDRNGKKIAGLEENFIINADNASFDLIYQGTDEGWVIR